MIYHSLWRWMGVKKTNKRVSYSLFCDVTEQREEWTAQAPSWNLYWNYIIITLLISWYRYHVNAKFIFASVVSNSLRLLRATIILKNSNPNKMKWHKKGFFIKTYSILRLFFALKNHKLKKPNSWFDVVRNLLVRIRSSFLHSAEFIIANCQLFACLCGINSTLFYSCNFFFP